MSGAHLHSVGLHVSDLGATASFYRLLGLRVPDDQAPVVAVAVPHPAGVSRESVRALGFP